MRIRNDADIGAFMTAVQSCREDVWFDTAAGDHLNLKSALSQFVFIAATVDPALIRSGCIVCTAAEDLPLLLPYLESCHAD